MATTDRLQQAREDEQLLEWLTRYGQILEATDKLLHEIRFCSNAEELWRVVGLSQDVEDLHDRVLYETGAVEKTLNELEARRLRDGGEGEGG